MQDILSYSLDFIFDFMQSEPFLYVLAAIMAFVLVNFFVLLCRGKKLW